MGPATAQAVRSPAAWPKEAPTPAWACLGYACYCSACGCDRLRAHTWRWISAAGVGSLARPRGLRGLCSDDTEPLLPVMRLSRLSSREICRAQRRSVHVAHIAQQGAPSPRGGVRRAARSRATPCRNCMAAACSTAPRRQADTGRDPCKAACVHTAPEHAPTRTRKLPRLKRGGKFWPKRVLAAPLRRWGRSRPADAAPPASRAH